MILRGSLSLSLLLFNICLLMGSPYMADSIKSKEVEKKIIEAPADTRYFHQLTIPVGASESDPFILPIEIYPAADSVEQHRARAIEFEAEVKRKGSIIENLTQQSLLDLPVGLSSPGGQYTIIISRARFNPTGAFLEVYCILDLPQADESKGNSKMAFRGKDIKFSYEGGLTGDGRLELVGNYHFEIGENTLLSVIGRNKKSFVEFNCNGFKEMGIEAEVEFSRDLIIPERENGTIIPAPAHVNTHFEVRGRNWNDMLVGVTLPPFQVAGFKDFGFSVTEAFMDWSDLVNPPGMAFPAGYTSPVVQGGQPQLWQGFYLKRLEIRLPPSFDKKKGDTSRIKLGVEQMILDDQGFSGKVFAENLIDAGDMNGWSYSLDRLGIELVTNQVAGFEIAGKLTVPLINNQEGKPSRFGYLAQRGADGNYIFAASIENRVKLPLFVADLTLNPGSSITVAQKNNGFYPTLMLNGHLGIKGTGSGPNPDLLGISFEGLRISTEEPKLDIQALGFGRDGQQQKVSNFPIAINNISVKKAEGRLGFGLDLTINIGGSASEEGFGGTAGLIVWGKRTTEEIKDPEGKVIGTNSSAWKFDKVEITAVGVRLKKPGVIELEGMIRFFDGDPTYGDGFKGSLSGKIQTITLEAEALFGKTPTYRYWYADALVKIETGIPMVPGVLSAYGFGGGFYSKMKQSTQPVASELGKTRSGITYVPDENTMGIRAIVLIGAASPAVWNGDVALEIALNRHGGINSVTFTGNASIMSPMALAGAGDKIKDLASSAVGGKLAEKLAGMLKGQVYGSIRIHYDNVNSVFHANAEIYINVAFGVVRGVSEGNKAGWFVMHFEKSDWYVLIGTPTQPLGIEVAGIFKAMSYIMMGMNLPGSPPPPPQVSEILGNIDLDYMRDMNSLQSGMGFAFGLHFILDTGDLTFLMFYARLAAGVGLDFMLKDYGTEMHCAGSTGAFGINGWYANGQSYAFVLGKVGIRVDLTFYKGNFDIISLGVAAVLQTKGPNPFWMRGIVGGYYSILGGLVKGKCKFEMTIGKECKPVGPQNLLANVKMIAEISPISGTNNVDVFNTPQVAFNIPIGQVFEIKDMENKPHYFRASLSEFTVTDNGSPLEGKLTWNSESDVVVLDALEILPPEKKLTAKAKLVFQERINGSWVSAQFKGKVVEEVAESVFETGKAPDHIPPNNVAYSYPINGQVNFYPNEYNKGFIQLHRGQQYLFNLGQEWVQKVRMTSGQRYLETDLTYEASARRVNLNLPAGFENTKVYQFEILNIPRQNTLIDANVQKVKTEVNTGDPAVSTSLNTKDIEGDMKKIEVKAIFTSNFRTSKYNTFGDKIRAMTLTPKPRVILAVDVFQLGAYVNSDELFDDVEVKGTASLPNIVRMEAVLTDNPWYTSGVYPLLYEGYPMDGRFSLTRRANPQLLGIPPARDMLFEDYVKQVKLAPEDVTYSPGVSYLENIRYNVSSSAFIDYRDIQMQAVDYFVGNPSAITQRMRSVITTPFPKMRYGYYQFRFQYFIPGSLVPNSSYQMAFFNNITD
jgi:hypothetical protein